jgi:signal transduction histidine kinase/integral membrane sensor domain MASE1
MKSSPSIWRLASLGQVATIALIYGLLTHLTLGMLHLENEASPLYPSAGFAVAATWRYGGRALLGVVLAALFNSHTHGGIVPSTGVAIAGQILEAAIGSYLLHRARFQPQLERLQDVAVLLGFGVALPSSINATIGTTNAVLAQMIPASAIGESWWIYLVGDGVGILLVLPGLLMWGRRPFWRPWQSRQQLGEMLVWTTVLLLAAWIGFGPRSQSPLLEYVPFLLIVWSALRFGPHWTVFSGMLISAIEIIRVLHQQSLFVISAGGNLKTAILLLQSFVGVTMMMSLLLAAAISERQQVIDRLQLQEARLNQAQQVARIGNWTAQAHGWDWSDQLYRLAGIVPGTVSPSRSAWSVLVAPADRDPVQQAFDQVIAGGQMQRLTYHLQLPDGTSRVVQEQIEPTPIGLVGTVQDITESWRRSEADRLLAEIAGRIRQSLDPEQIMQATVDEVREFLKADRVYLAQEQHDGYGLILAESVDRRYPSILPYRSPPMVVAALKQYLSAQRVRQNPDTSQSNSSPLVGTVYTTYQIKSTIIVGFSITGHLSNLLVVNQCHGPRVWQPDELEFIERLADQVELALKQGLLYRQVQNSAADLEQQVKVRTGQIQTNLEELEKLNRLKDRLLHAVSHDLKTPVLGSLLVLQRLSKSADDPVALSRAVLDQLTQSSERQLGLIQSLLEDHAPQATTLTVHRSALALGPLVQSVIAGLEPQLSLYRAQVDNQVAADLPLIWADATHLRRVFENLIVNALKHNPPGLKLTLTAYVQEADPTPGQTAVPMVHCRVIDNGVGISAAQCEQMFTHPYLRSTHDRRVTGLGLGLFICHQVIQAHGGEIGVSSAPQQGAQFWFTVPTAASNPAPSTGKSTGKSTL